MLFRSPQIHWGLFREMASQVGEPAVGQFCDGGYVQEDEAGGAGAGADCGQGGSYAPGPGFTGLAGTEEGSHPDPGSLGAVLGAQAFWGLAMASCSQMADPERSRCFD